MSKVAFGQDIFAWHWGLQLYTPSVSQHTIDEYPPCIYFDYALHPKYASIVSYLPWWHYMPQSIF